MIIVASQLFLFLVLNAVVFHNAMWLTCWLGGWKTWAERLLDAFLYFVALIVMGFFLLHFAHWVTIDGLLVVHSLTALVLIWIGRKRGWRIRDFFSLDPIRGLGWVGQLLLCLLVAWCLAYIYYCRYLPPRATDPLAYHLPQPVQWLKVRQLSLFPAYYTASAVIYSPIDGELFLCWLIAPFGNDVVVRFGQMPMLAATVLALYVIARHSSLFRSLALGCGCLLLIFRPFLLEIVMPNVDLMLTAWFLIFVVQWQRLDDRWQSWARCGLTLGLLAGTKFIGLLYLVPCLALVAYKQLQLQHVLIFPRAALRWTCLGAAIFALGSFGYLRNWVITGSPFYPAGLSVAGVTLFSSVMDSNSMASVYHTWRNALFGLFTRDTFGMQPITAWIWGLAVLGGLICCFVERDRRERIALWMLLPLSWAVIFWKLPWMETRYLFPIYGLGFVFLGWLLGWLGPITRHWLVTLVLLAIATCLGWESIQIKSILVWAMICAVVLFGFVRLFLFLGKVLRPQQRVWAGVGLPVAAACGIALLWTSYLSNYQEVKFHLYQPLWPRYANAWGWLNAQTKGSESVVAYTGSAFIYPLFGADLQNSLIHAPVTKEGHRFAHELDLPAFARVQSFIGFEQLIGHAMRDSPDPQAWLKRILDARATFLVILRESENDPIEDRWAAQSPAIFHNVFESEAVTIYQVQPTP